MNQESIGAAPGGQPHRWHALPLREAVAAVESDADWGLSAETAARRLARHGPNALPETNRRSLVSVFFGQFKSPLIYLLFFTAGVALVLGHGNDAAVIFIVLLLNAIVGAVQEGRAEISLAALRKLASRRARVVRGGEELIIEARDVVPGDILLLEAGEAVAADARLLHGAALQIAEAALTGESLPVAKNLRPLAPDTPVADRHNMVYAGTHVTAGRARTVVVATGVATEIGRIAALAETAAQPKTPLERRIAQFGRHIIIAAGALFVVVNAIGLLRGIPFDQLVMVAISQVVGLIPEGLPVAMTIALAVGVQRMARRRAVIRRLAAVETLGSITVICSDKTGTLTRNEMTVMVLSLPDGREVVVTGTGYEPEGKFSQDGREVDPLKSVDLRGLLEAVVLCNDAQLNGPSGSEPRWKPIGDPTEVALVTLAIKGGVVPGEVRKRWPRRAEIPFDSSTKVMATQHGTETDSRIVIKGAPEVVLSLCYAARRNGEDVPLDDAARLSLLRAAERMADRALRLLAVAVVERAELGGKTGIAHFHQRASLLGLVGQIDPPRPEATAAVRQCIEAGIRPVMVTGDHKATARAVAGELGILREGDTAVDGRELEELSDDALAERIEGISVFARVHPAQKLRIVAAYQKRGEVVAMTGDGVNDAPALVKADVGVAMGITGTDVAKEAARIVISDDNFASIVAVVEEGRVVNRNIKKVILYLLSTSLPAVLVLLVALALGYPPPLEAVQILWINLVTEGTVTVNLIMEPSEGDEMRERPIPPDEPLVTRLMMKRMALFVPAIATSMFGWFAYRISAGIPLPQVQTETFTLLAVAAWFSVLNCRSARDSIFNASLLRNPWLVGGLIISILLQVAVVFFPPLAHAFHAVPFGLEEVLAIGAVASLVLWVEESRKLIARRQARARAGAGGQGRWAGESRA